MIKTIINKKTNEIITHDTKYNFYETFNMNTGFYVRSGIYENGVDTNVDPFMRLGDL